MNFCSKDILQPIPFENIPKLRDLFKSDWPFAVHVFYFIDTYLQWKKGRPLDNYITFYCPNGNFEDGTFVAIIEMMVYDVFIFTLDKTLRRLETALRETKLIDWQKRPVFSAVKQDFFDMVVRVRSEINQPVFCDVPSHVWWLPKEKALQYEYSIPSNLYVAPLNESHIDTMNAVWPHRFPGSEKYLAKVLELNGGIGLFMKSDDELCCWVLKNYFGGLGVLQTAEKHKRKGYGSLITRIFSKMLAEIDGYDSTGFIVRNNIASQKMFTSLGYEKIIPVTWCLYEH